jgi:hypothetical protein
MEDQNFFYYDKERSDVFVLAMIIVDIALLSSNFLYDINRKKPALELIPGLINKVAEHYSPNLVSLLAEMLRIESENRPKLSQIIERIEKCNNLGEDFTVETESNLKSNDFSS